MSISGWRKSRGFSTGAVFLLAAFLTLTAVAVQSTIPMPTSSPSEVAAVAAPTTSGPAAVPSSKCNAGEVHTVDEASNSNPKPEDKIAKCYIKDTRTGSPTIGQMIKNPDPNVQKDPACQIAIPNACKVRYCPLSSMVKVAGTCIEVTCDTGATGSDDNNTCLKETLGTAMKPGSDSPSVLASLQNNSNLPNNLQITGPSGGAVYGDDAIHNAFTPGAAEAYDASQKIADNQQQQQDVQKELQDCVVSGCNDTEIDKLKKQQDDLKAEAVKLNDDLSQKVDVLKGEHSDASVTTDKGEKIGCFDTGATCYPANDDQQKYLANNGFTCKNNDAGDMECVRSGGTQPPGTSGHPGQTSSGGTGGQRPPGTGGGSSPFGNPNLGANNQPQSPFGGACNTRYVCSGNTLYYQSANSIGMYGGYNPYGGVPGGSGQCMTQPVQQCQYGCQQMAAQTGAQSTLGTVAAGLQVFSSVLKLFGGGNSGSNTLANTNLPSSCAMTPQQGMPGAQSPYGTGTNGQPCYQPPQQPDPAQCTSGHWQATSGQQNGCTTGWQCVPDNNGAGTKPNAQLSCQPQIADVGMPISFSFACGNASGSTGTGFSTGGALSGNATTSAPNPPSGQNTATFTLTCVNQGITASAQCQVQLSKSGIVLITNPKIVKNGDISLIGWVTSGMQSCVISSPDQQDFTARNAGNLSVNGAATTSPITSPARFQLACQSIAGGTKIATTTVTVN